MAFETLKQLTFPKALRIPDLGAERLEDVVGELRSLLEGLEPPDNGGSEDSDVLAKVVLEVWRIEKRLGYQMADKARKVRQMMAPFKELLEANEASYRDFSGEPYDRDELWDDVIGRENEPPLVIREMFEPRIYIDGRVVRRGTPVLESQPAA